MFPPADFPALKAVSARIGADPLRMQGPGGNTSVKQGATMWIKASGTELARRRARDIFVAVDLVAARRCSSATIRTPTNPRFSRWRAAGSGPRSRLACTRCSRIASSCTRIA